MDLEPPVLLERGANLEAGITHNYFKWQNMIFFLRLITTLALLIAIAWLYVDPKFDSAFATTIALAAVIALFVTTKKKKRSPNQSQVGTNHSTGIQAGGDVNIGSNQTSKVSKHDVK